MISSIEYNGLSLYYSFLKDEEAVLKAVKQNSKSFQYASEILKNDRDVNLMVKKMWNISNFHNLEIRFSLNLLTK